MIRKTIVAAIAAVGLTVALAPSAGAVDANLSAAIQVSTQLGKLVQLDSMLSQQPYTTLILSKGTSDEAAAFIKQSGGVSDLVKTYSKSNLKPRKGFKYSKGNIRCNITFPAPTRPGSSAKVSCMAV